MFVVQYDLSDMPSNSFSFIRQKTYYMPKCLSNAESGNRAAGSLKIPNQTNELNSSKQLSNENLNSNHSPVRTANKLILPPTNLTASLSTTDLTSNLPTNLTTKSKCLSASTSKCYSISSSSKEVDDNKLCNLQFKSSWLRYLIHLRFLSTKSGKIYLHRDISMLILKKNEFDPGNLIGQTTYHWITEQITENASDN